MKKKPTQENVDAIVLAHEAWLGCGSGGCRAYFDYMDLSGLNLSNCNLSRACFVGCQLDGTNFANSILTGAVFDYAQGESVRRPAHISGASFVGAHVQWSEEKVQTPEVASSFGAELQKLLDKHGLKLGAPLLVMPK